MLDEFGMDIQLEEREEPAVDLQGFFYATGFYKPVDGDRFGGKRADQAGHPSMGKPMIRASVAMGSTPIEIAQGDHRND